MVSDGLHDRPQAAVSDAKALAGHASDVRFARCRSVERDIANDDVLLRHERGPLGGIDDDLTSREALSNVVVGVSLQDQCHSTRDEGPEALASRSFEVKLNRAIGKPIKP